MDYYFGYIQAIDDFGFLDEIDARVDINTMVKITEEERNQLLTDNGQGKDIILYNGEVFTAEPLQYIRQNNEYVPNPNYEQQQAEKRREQFHLDFFNTTIGYIRRKVSMKTGETKDFLTDLLPVISMAVNSGQQVNIITYIEPDFTHDITDWEALQVVKQATPQFIQECFNQVSTDFTGI